MVAQASWASATAKPRSAPARTVASNAHAGHHPADDQAVNAAVTQVLLERRAQEAVRVMLLDHGLAGQWRDRFVDLDAACAGA
jgi:hypothetical protein